MSTSTVRAVRGAAGLVVLIALLLVVRGWWQEYRTAVEQQRRGPGQERARDESPTAGGEATGEGRGERPAPEAPAAPTRVRTEVVVLIDGLNFRTDPSRTARAIRGLDRGERLLLIGERGGWYQVRDRDGTEGWVSANPTYTRTERR